jgi:hypothetical protein
VETIVTITMADVVPDVDRSPICTAAVHDTDRAYRKFRCRCPEATRAHNAYRGLDKPRTNPTCGARRH